MQSIENALELILSNKQNFGTETISIHDCLDRVLAEDIYADRDYPPFNRATMDGYAIISQDINIGKNNLLKITDTIHAGEAKQFALESGNCIKIMTGAPVPQRANAVIRIEDTHINGNEIHFNVKQVKENQNIAIQGEDARKGDLLIKKGTKLNPNSISLLAVTGHAKLEVYKLPIIAIVSTGNEIVAVESVIQPHQIRDSNVHTLKNSLLNYCISAIQTALIVDDKIALKNTLSELLNTDIIIISGGVSKGDADYVPEILKHLGVIEIFHRVSIKPGNPLWFGKMPNGGVVFGLPGNPISVQVGYKVFIESFLRKCFDMEPIEPIFLPLLGEKSKKSNFTEYFPCKLTHENKKSGLAINKMNTSGDISTTNNSDGIAIHPSEKQTIEKGEFVEFYFW
ncbi:MAG: molybdopterin molybdotransferase MoeA [Chitinophagales bacterium]|nr:molybdopterin molybdotransferase MoeA [Chitinophagales bacterium]